MAAPQFTRCVNCDTPIGPSEMQTDTLWYSFEALRPRETEHPLPWEYCPLTDLCLHCLLASELRRAWDYTDYFDPQILVDKPWIIQCLPGSAIGSRDYSAVVVAKELEVHPIDACGIYSDTSSEPWSAHRIRDHAYGLNYVYQSWMRRIRYRHSPLCVEERWNPATGLSIHLVGLEATNRLDHAECALKGVELLRELKRKQSGGRKALSLDEANGRFREIVDAYAGCLTASIPDYESGRIKKPTQLVVLRRLYYGHTTLNDLLAKHSLTPEGAKISWEQVYQAALAFRSTGHCPEIYRISE